MVTNHLHGPDKRRAAAGGVGGPAWEGEYGELALKGPVVTVGTGTMGPGPFGQPVGRYLALGSRCGAEERQKGSSSSEGNREGAREAMRLPNPVQPPALWFGNSDPEILRPPAPSPTVAVISGQPPPACPASSSPPPPSSLLAIDWLPSKTPTPAQGSRRPVREGGRANSFSSPDNS